MNHIVRLICAVTAILGTAAETGLSAEAPANGSSGDEAAIRGVLEKFGEAWNRHDANAFAMAFAEDADFTNVRGMSAHGRTEIAQFHAPIFATIFKESALKIDELKVRFIKPDVAAVDEWWQMTGARDQRGQEIPLRKGLLNALMTRQNGHWVIAVMHNMDLPLSE